MKKKQLLKNSIIGLLLLSLPNFVLAQNLYKKQKTFSVQVFQKDTLYEVQVRNTSKRIFASQKEDRVYYWYNSGTILKNQGGYAQNPLHGKCVIKNTQKKMIAQGEFKNGLRIGEWKFWDAYGNLMYTQEYKKGKKHGTTTLYSQGIKTQTKDFKKDKLHGKSIQYIQPPQKIISTFKHGVCVKTDTIGIQKLKENKTNSTLNKPHKKQSVFSKKEKARYDLLNNDTQEKPTVFVRCKSICNKAWKSITKPFRKKQTDTK